MIEEAAKALLLSTVAGEGERDLNRRAFILEALDGDRSAEGLDAVTQADEPRAARRIAAADPVVTRDDA